MGMKSKKIYQDENQQNDLNNEELEHHQIRSMRDYPQQEMYDTRFEQVDTNNNPYQNYSQPFYHENRYYNYQMNDHQPNFDYRENTMSTPRFSNVYEDEFRQQPQERTEQPTTPQPTQYGRKKIEMKFIKDRNRRSVTFSKRKKGIMKKAYELSVLTGSEVLLLVASESGHVYTFGTPKLRPIISKQEYIIQQCLSGNHPLSDTKPYINDESNFIPHFQQQRDNNENDDRHFVDGKDFRSIERRSKDSRK